MLEDDGVRKAGGEWRESRRRPPCNSRDAAVIEREPKGIDRSTCKPRRFFVEIEAERTNDNGATFCNRVQALKDTGERGTGEGQVQEEDGPVIEVGVAYVGVSESSARPKTSCGFAGPIYEQRLNLDATGGRTGE